MRLRRLLPLALVLLLGLLALLYYLLFEGGKRLAPGEVAECAGT